MNGQVAAVSVGVIGERVLLDLDYEALVSEPEPRARALLAHCGLPWDERCLRFHETTRAVHTASAWQVRQPINRHGVGRWRGYASHLGAAREALRDYLPPEDWGRPAG